MTHQSAKSCSEVGPANNEVDEAVALQKFCSLEPGGQILMGRFSNNPWSGEPNHAFWLRQDDVPERSEAGHYSGSGWVGQNDEIGKAELGMACQGGAGFGHLHEA